MTARSVRYIDFLPTPYREGDPGFLDAYLAILQGLLDRREEVGADSPGVVARRGLGEIIDILPQLFHPRLSFLFPDDDAFIPPLQPPKQQDVADRTFDALNDLFGIADPPAGDTWQANVSSAVATWLDELLDWQAGWIGLVPDGAWTLDEKRRVIATILPLYRQRGTARGLQGLLDIWVGGNIDVVDLVDATPLTIGATSELARHATPASGRLDGVRPFAFEIVLSVPTYDFRSDAVRAKVEAIRRLVDREKPVGTAYTIAVKASTTRLGVDSTVGVAFLLPLSQTRN